MNAERRRPAPKGSRFDVVLRLEIAAIGKVVDGEIEIELARDASNQAQVDDRIAGGSNRGVLTVKAVAVDGAQPQRARPALVLGKRQTRIGGKVGRPVHVTPRRGVLVERIAHFGDPAAQIEVAVEGEARFGFKAMGSAWAEELKGPVVSYINQFIGSSDVKAVERQRKTLKAR